MNLEVQSVNLFLPWLLLTTEEKSGVYWAVELHGSDIEVERLVIPS